MSKKIVEIRKNSYFDSVTLMSISAAIKKTEGVLDAVISMATDMNKELLARVGLMTEEIAACTENDLVIAAMCEDGMEPTDITALVEEKLKGDKNASEEKEEVYKSVKAAKGNHPEADMVIISVPGEHAAREAMNALKLGMNVMLFSDNVAIEEELALKQYAHEKDLLVMGPDCGTAYINHTALCFANVVNEGTVGIVGASGTGMQEMMVLVDRFGGGISNAIGVGGRDLTSDIGGIMMIDGLRMLQADENTKTIVIVSKVPAPEVKDRIMEIIHNEITKPVVIYFSTDKVMEDTDSVIFGRSLKEAAQIAVCLDSGMTFMKKAESVPEKKATAKNILGMYCGGTLCAEAYYYLRNRVKDIHSNIAKVEEEKMKDVFSLEGNILLDLGDDVFTNGRPHPMIDPTIRLDRIIEACKQKTTGVVLLDFELGYGSHEDPVGATIDAIIEGKKQNPEVTFVTYVCGTDRDDQNKRRSEKLLLDAGCIVAESNIDAVKKAYELV